MDMGNTEGLVSGGLAREAPGMASPAVMSPMLTLLVQIAVLGKMGGAGVSSGIAHIPGIPGMTMALRSGSGRQRRNR